MTDESALVLVSKRNEFYRDSYRKVLGAFMLSLLVNAGLILLNFYQFTHRPAPRYFATTQDGRMIPLYSFRDPVLTNPILLQWVQRAIIASYTYNFLTYREQLMQASVFFTPEGWNSFMSALKSSRNLDTVIAKKLSTTAVATGAPVILNERVINGSFTWQIQMPILVTYESGTQKIQRAYNVVVLVQRVSTLESTKGVAITQFYAEGRG